MTPQAEPGTDVPLLPARAAIRGALRHVAFRVTAVIEIRGIKLRDLQMLAVGQIVASESPATDDVPVLAGGVTFAFAELDSADGQMALRVTRLR